MSSNRGTLFFLCGHLPRSQQESYLVCFTYHKTHPQHDSDNDEMPATRTSTFLCAGSTYFTNPPSCTLSATLPIMPISQMKKEPQRRECLAGHSVGGRGTQAGLSPKSSLSTPPGRWPTGEIVPHNRHPVLLLQSAELDAVRSGPSCFLEGQQPFLTPFTSCSFR